jgi:uncharacterized surface anchored protein
MISRFVGPINVLVLLWFAAGAGYPAEFRVRVVTQDYEGLDHAEVTVTSQQISREAMTDGTGTAIFADLPEGRCDVKVGARGFRLWQSLDYEVGSSQGRGLLATLSAGELGCPSLLVVVYDNAQPRKGPVRGAVVDADSLRGIKGATITLQLLDGSGRRSTIRSGKAGLFEVKDLSPGRYGVSVTKEGFQETDAK